MKDSTVMSAMRRWRTGGALSVLALALATSGTAHAQDTSDSADGMMSEEGDDSIVVIGTLIRGTEVVGSQVISVSEEEITRQGAVSTNDILQLVPQITNTFNTRSEVDPRGISGAGITIQRPNLRNLPGINSASGGTTLVLMDGLRLTPVGVNQSAVDVDIIPSAVLAGLDVITDGGTSLYGADAVAGVLNFRTKQSFDGVEVDANYGFGDTISSYGAFDASMIAGTSWSSGNAYIAAEYYDRGLVRNGDVDYATGAVFDADGNPSFTNTQCIDPVRSERRFFNFGRGWTDNPAAPGAGVFGIGSGCDQNSAGTFLPRQDRLSVFAQVSQEIADNIDFRATAYFTKRDIELTSYPRGFTSAAPPVVLPDPSSAPVGTVIAFDNGVGFSFGANDAYVNTPSRIGLETYGITPQLTINLGGDWQVVNSAHIGRSTNSQSFPQVNGQLAQDYINAGALDPLNVGAADAAVILDITDFETAQDTTHEFALFRSVFDGPLVRLPGGDAKLAVGFEYQGASAETRQTTDRVGVLGTLDYNRAERHAKSIFGELALPLFDWVDLSVSVRHDSYSDFGSTTNPSIGVAFKPLGWLKIYGNYNTSFNAPNPIDAAAEPVGRLICGIYSPASPPTDPLGNYTGGDCALVAEGPNAGLRPQTAKTWSAGFEATPGDFRFGAQFYSINFDDALGAVNPQNVNTYITNPELYIHSPSPAEFTNFVDQLGNSDSIYAQVDASRIGQIVDRRTSNISAAKIQGVDFHIYYARPTSFGNISLGLNGTKQTKSERETGGTVSNELGILFPELTARAFATATAGPVTGKVTVNYSGKYRDGQPDYLGNEVVVDPFVTTNLFLGYRFEDHGGALAGTSIRLLVDNVFGETPDLIKRGNPNQISYAGFSLGRVFRLGFTKRF